MNDVSIQSPSYITWEANSAMIDCDGEMAMPIVTSHSIDGTFSFCQRKFEFAHVYQQVPDYAGGGVGLAAESGTAIHEAVQAWATVWLDPAAEQIPDLWVAAVDAGLFALLQWWPWVTENLAAADKKLAAKQRGLDQSIRLYHTIIEHEYWKEFELAVLPDGKPAIEIPWRVVHRSIGVLHDSTGRARVLVTQGKIDFILRHKPSGMLRVVDLKTTVKMPESLFSAFRFSGQAVGYSLVLGGALGLNWRDGMTVAYLTASFNDFAIRPITFRISAQEIEDYLMTRQDLLFGIARNLRRQWWPRRLHGCDSYASSCHYLDICQQRDSRFIDAWFSRDDVPFVERPRIYQTIWDFSA